MTTASRFRKWDFVDAADRAAGPELATLSRQLSEFYARAGATGYWETAEGLNSTWSPSTHPYHCHLRQLIGRGDTVVEFGCGSAHAARNLAEREVRYIGIDVSPMQVRANQATFPEHRFLCADMTAPVNIGTKVDWALSLFSLEHCVWPQHLLEQMAQAVKARGRIGILCPNFTTGMNSLRSGLRATTKRDKLGQKQLVDLCLSYIEEKLIWPRRIRRIHESAMQFPIYLYPRCLDAAYFPDNDAVYLVTEAKLRRVMERWGWCVEASSQDVPVAERQFGGVTYLVARVA